MKKGMLKRIPVICLLAIMMLVAVSCKMFTTQDIAQFDVEMKSGYGNNVEIGAYAPFYIEITNNGKDFEGYVQLIIPGRDNMNVMHEKELTLAAGATKTVELVGFIDMPTRQVNVRILDKNENVIWEKLQKCSTMTDLRNVNIGILSDDYAALGYMDHKPFTANPNLTTQIHELSKDTLPSDWRALDMLDVIVISDFSTDLLSEEQLNALALWVDDGGLLMVGTGSTANKTMASLDGRFFDVAPGEWRTYNTMYGLTLADFNYDYSYSNSYSQPYNDYTYQAYYEDNYEAIRDILEEEYMTDFQIIYGYDPQYDTWDTYWEDSFYWYCYDEFYELYLNVNGITGGDLTEQLSYVNAGVLEITGEELESKDTVVFQGETQKELEVYDLAYAMPRGDGYVFLTGVDFTKTPLIDFDGNSTIFVHWVETLIGQKLSEEVDDYSGYSYGYYNLYDIDYDEENIYENVASATVPPVLLYFGILFLYVIAILVVYLVLRKKKITIKLWVIYPAIAAGLSILIFCIGFSTRIYRPVISGVTLIQPNGSTLTEDTYTGITVPRNREYDISFASNQAVEYMQYNRSGSSYDDQMEVDWDRYTIGYHYGYDAVDVSVGQMAAMDTVYFHLTSVVPSERTVVVESANGYETGLSVTNNFGCTLENAVLIVNGNFYVIGDMKDGDSVRWTSLQKAQYVYQLGDAAMSSEKGNWLLGLMFGSISGKYDEYLRNIRALNSITGIATDYYNGADVVFVAIPADFVAEEIQGDTNYAERRAEIIYVEYNY